MEITNGNNSNDAQNDWGFILDFLPDAALLHDGYDILHVNRAACRFFAGETPDQLVGGSYIDRIHPDDRSLVLTRISTVFHGKPSSLREYRIVDLNGEFKDVEAKATLVQYEGTTCNLVIFRDTTERKRQQNELLKLNERLRSMQARQMQLSRSLLITGERRNAFLAMELHDRIGQPLSSLKMNLERTLLKSHTLSPEERLAIEECVDSLKQSIFDLKRMSSELLPSIIANLGLIPSLKSLRDKVANQSSLKVHVFTNGVAGRYRDDIEIAVYRVAQEGLNNAVKHAGAENCFINLLDDGRALSLSVEDDGRGFDAASKSLACGDTFSLGLHIMRERIEQLGGEFSIDSTPGSGTGIVAVVPVNVADRRVPAKDP